MICLLYAHPYPDRSRANRALLTAVADLPELEIRRLFDLYPDFAIDTLAEQEALTRAQVIVFQHPIYWYGVPGLLKHWIDTVLSLGWAYGHGGSALHGKTLLWVTTTGAPEQGYSADGIHGHGFAQFIAPIQQTALFCGMRWAEPLIVFGAHRIDEPTLRAHAADYRARLLSLAQRAKEASP